MNIHLKSDLLNKSYLLPILDVTDGKSSQMTLVTKVPNLAILVIHNSFAHCGMLFSFSNDFLITCLIEEFIGKLLRFLKRLNVVLLFVFMIDTIVIDSFVYHYKLYFWLFLSLSSFFNFSLLFLLPWHFILISNFNRISFRAKMR